MKRRRVASEYYSGLDGLLCCGVDEAGRGPLAGAVYAAAVILDAARPIDGLADSKVLRREERERLAEGIRAQALAWAVAFASVEEIDRFNILRATFMAMRRAVAGLSHVPDEVIVDGKKLHAKALKDLHNSDVVHINLPGGDALVVIKRLTTMGAMTPIVAVSADASNRRRVLDAGADAFLVKPFDAGALVGAVRSAFGEAEAPASTTPVE